MDVAHSKICPAGGFGPISLSTLQITSRSIHNFLLTAQCYAKCGTSCWPVCLSVTLVLYQNSYRCHQTTFSVW